MGSVLDYVITNKNLFTSQNLLDVALDVLNGLNHIHQEGMIYRDLALRNVLLYENKGRICAKISDFGWSCLVNQEDGTYKSEHHVSGPWRILAPECIENLIFSKASDMWSFGLFLYSILARKRPYDKIDQSQVREKILSGERIDLDQDTETLQNFKEIIQQCLQENPKHRTSVMDMIEILKDFEIQDDNLI